MRIDAMIAYARDALARLEQFNGRNLDGAALHAGKEIIGNVCGRTSDLYLEAETHAGIAGPVHVVASLRAMIELYERGILSETSLRRQAQADVLADLFDQAAVLLDKPDFHPAAPAILVGGALEQFLRSWVEEKKLEVRERATIDDYAKALRAADVIDKGDKKDIDSWADTRNRAAHGEMGSGEMDRARVRYMMDGVNLFLRKHDARDRP